MSEANFFHSAPPLFGLTGIDGCGKSTHLRKLAERLQQDRGVSAAILSVWDISGNPRYQSHPFISDKAAIYRYLASLHGGSRMLFIAHALMESLELLIEQKPDLIFVDGYWYKYLFSESLFGLPLDRLLKTVSGFPVPGRIILLDLPAERSWARKPEVTPYECGLAQPSEQSFLSFQTKLRKELMEFGKKQGWPVVYADRPENDVAAELWELFINADSN